MNISISGQHLDIGDALKHHISDQIQHHIAKYFPDHGTLNANVKLTKNNKHGNTGIYHAIIVLQVEKISELILRSNTQDADPYACVDRAIAKMKNQILHYKNKISSHSNKKNAKLSIIKRVIQSHSSEMEYDPDINMMPYTNSDDTFLSAKADDFNSEQLAIEDEAMAQQIIAESEAQPNNPILKEEVVAAEKMHLDEAIMRMELQHAPAYFFINAKNNHMCMLYRREDGHISWIDTQTVVAQL